MTAEQAQERTSMLPAHLNVPEECRAISEVLERVGDKWSVLVVVTLGDGSKRFSELRRQIASISQRMLTLTLRGLERDGLVSRTVFPTIPPRVDYELTALGRSLLEPVAAQRHMRLERSFPADLPPFLADADLLSRAVENLVSNAIKYSPDGTVVTVSARADEEYLTIEVADHGYGISEADLERVFEKFYRVPRVQDADVPGTGLGLALVREIAELHHGSVSVRSEVDKGSTFSLRIPRNEARKESE